MLVRLPHLPSRDPIIEILTKALGEGSRPSREQQIADGVYEISHFNFNHVLEANGRLVSEHPYEPFWDAPNGTEEETQANLRALRAFHEDDTLPVSYGVCDHWRQIIKRWPRIVTDDKPLVISITRIVKAEEPYSGGWRWHKWGEYIGDKSPQFEYIHDEGPEIEEVFVWSLFEVRR